MSKWRWLNRLMRKSGPIVSHFDYLSNKTGYEFKTMSKGWTDESKWKDIIKSEPYMAYFFETTKDGNSFLLVIDMDLFESYSDPIGFLIKEMKQPKESWLLPSIPY